MIVNKINSKNVHALTHTQRQPTPVVFEPPSIPSPLSYPDCTPPPGWSVSVWCEASGGLGIVGGWGGGLNYRTHSTF